MALTGVFTVFLPHSLTSLAIGASFPLYQICDEDLTSMSKTTAEAEAERKFV